MELKLSTSAVTLLRHTFSYTGEKEIGKDGQEVLSPRRLNGDDSAQRRHFFKKTADIVKSYQDVFTGNNEEFNKFSVEVRAKLTSENPQLEGEKPEDYATRINFLLSKSKEMEEKYQELDKKVLEEKKKINVIEVTDKTKEVLKKYFLEFGEKEGFVEADDEHVEEINEALK